MNSSNKKKSIEEFYPVFDLTLTRATLNFSIFSSILCHSGHHSICLFFVGVKGKEGFGFLLIFYILYSDDSGSMC